MRFISIILIISFSILVPFEAFAQIPGIGKPFGGIVLVTIPCPCSANAMLIVGPPRGGRFMLDFGSKLYSKYQPFTGHWVLGLADGFSPCLIPILIGCTSIGGGSRIRMLGTS